MTRLYLTGGTSPVADPVDPVGWNHTAGKVVRKLSATKEGLGNGLASDPSSTINGWLSSHGLWVHDQQVTNPGPLTMTGGVTCRAGLLENSSSANAFWVVGIYAISADGTVRRSGGGAAVATLEHPTTATGRAFSVSNLPSIPAVEATDRIMVLVGAQFQNTSSSSFNATLYYGGTSATEMSAGLTGTDVTSAVTTGRVSPHVDFDDPSFDSLFLPPPAPPRGNMLLFF